MPRKNVQARTSSRTTTSSRMSGVAVEVSDTPTDSATSGRIGLNELIMIMPTMIERGQPTGTPRTRRPMKATPAAAMTSAIRFEDVVHVASSIPPHPLT